MAEPSGRISKHPLMGADLATLFTLFTTNGPVERRHWGSVALLLLVAAGRWPLSTIESLVVRAQRRKVAGMPPPVFILGHWRSGTTHLYNIMSKSPRFGFVPPVATGLPWDFLVLGRMIRPLLDRSLPEHRYIDNVVVAPDSPQEDEIPLASMTGPSFYHGLYFPSRLRQHFDRGVFFDGVCAEDIARWQTMFAQFLTKLQLAQPDRRLVIKNPVYTARVGLLSHLFPEAKFIHIVRNPYVVFESMRNFYAKLLPEMAFQPHDGVDLDGLILDGYARMMDRLLADQAALPTSRFVETRFETFEAEPLAEMARIYEAIELGPFEADRPAFEAYLSGIEGYRKNTYQFQPAGDPRVTDRWQRFIEHWGYAPPEVPAEVKKAS